MKNASKTPNKNLYPSRREIISYPRLITPEAIYSLQRWKNNYYTHNRYKIPPWHEKSIKDKNEALMILVRIYITGTVYHTKYPMHQVELTLTTQYATDLKSHILYFNEVAPSIISTLHEVDHLLYGPSELKACAYSYQLFNEVFPTECANLEWCGHMLVKKQQQKRVNLG